ncbi:MAG: cupin domain-containing protein [Clostridiales bacterium]|jgi:transcriptional regulator with XRE-family HTH domain|nr:cupin domain-containing protein [Clostridiales bacterium]
MSDQLKEVKRRIRELREISGYSALETAESLDMDEREYYRCEEGGDDIPISLIYRVANLFHVDTTDILSGKSPKLTTISVVRKGEGIMVERFAGYKYENIAYSFVRRTMEPMIVTLDPGGKKPELVTHSGQELNHCLSGQMRLIYDDSETILAAGDSAYFDARFPHGQMAAGDEPARFLTVINE